LSAGIEALSFTVTDGYLMDRLLPDIRYSFRRMAKSPGFTSIAILSLALGIGANTAIFSLVNSILLSGVPMRAPQELVEIYTSEEDDGYPYSISAYPDLVDLRERTDLFAGVAGHEAFFSRLETEASTEPIWGEVVSWNIFSLLGIEPELGRFFVHEEGQTIGTHPVVVLGYDYWQKRLGGDPDILGESLRLGGRQYTVVGVAPEALQGFTAPGFTMDMFAPFMMSDALNFEGDSEHLTRRTSRSTFIKARLAAGVTVDQARAALETLSARQREAYPEAWRGRSFNLLPSSEVTIHPFVDGTLYGVAALLLTVVALVLLIACTNLAGFLLARASDRKKEIALRLALGAKRWTLVRQLLTETIILGVMGGLAGLLVANWVLQALMAFQPPIPIPINLDVGLDGTVLLFTLGVSALAGAFFGLVPALQSTKADLAPTLKDESGTGTGRQNRFSLRNTLIVTQVASTGLYGTVAFSVSRRTREMGIRLSLGADAGTVVGMILRGAMGLVAVGVVIGLVLSLGLAQAIRGFLYGVGAMDPVTFLGVPALLAAVALVAAFVPARRASRVNPIQALKSE
jgi:predicted permease